MSYMDGKNLIKESFFDMLKKFFNKPKLSAKDKKLMKNPEFKKIYNDYMEMSKKTDKALDAALKKQGIKSRF